MVQVSATVLLRAALAAPMVAGWTLPIGAGAVRLRLRTHLCAPLFRPGRRHVEPDRPAALRKAFKSVRHFLAYL
jgi:hypothetical protein